MSKYIKPPESENCIWRSGPPPEIGWWPAGYSKNPIILRYWDGDSWSLGMFSYETTAIVDYQLARYYSRHYEGNIFWTDRWWIK